MPHSNKKYLCGKLVSVIFPCGWTETTSDLSVDTGLIYWCLLATRTGQTQTMLTPYLKELIPSVFSGQWLSSDVMGRRRRRGGGGVKLWMKNHSVDVEDDADYSSLLPSKPLLSRGISHQRDEDCITPQSKVSRLQAAANDWYHHLDYSLDQGFQNFLMSKTYTSIYIIR